MPSFARRTLFWKYAAYFSGLVSALLILSGGVGGYFAYRGIHRRTGSAPAREGAGRGQPDCELRRPTGRRPAIDRQQVQYQRTDRRGGSRVELVALLRHQPSITELHWVAADGREKFALSRIVPDARDSGRDWSDDPRFAGTRESHAIRRTGVFPSRDRTLPVARGGRSPGGPALVAEINLKFVWDVISQIRAARRASSMSSTDEANSFRIPTSAWCFASPISLALPQVRSALARRNPEASLGGEARNLDGLAVFAAAVPIEHLGWTVFAEQSREVALRPVYASIARSVVLVLLGVIASVTASLLFARSMVRPIRQIEARAREIGEGKLDQRIDVGTGDELEALGVQFNRMAERLQEIHSTQETRIAERTRDLALANDAKTRFLAAASHDLRQPIHALALFVGQLRADPGSPEAPALLEKIERSVEALEELLEALLDLSKLDVGAVTAQPQTVRAAAISCPVSWRTSRRRQRPRASR